MVYHMHAHRGRPAHAPHLKLRAMHDCSCTVSLWYWPCPADTVPCNLSGAQPAVRLAVRASSWCRHCSQDAGAAHTACMNAIEDKLQGMVSAACARPHHQVAACGISITNHMVFGNRGNWQACQHVALPKQSLMYKARAAAHLVVQDE